MKSDQLIPLLEDEIDGDLLQTVDARYLHAFLEVKTQFSMWIQRRIQEYGFVINVDYLFLIKNGEKSDRGRPTDEYHLTMDMAKELAMVERNKKGRQARHYFIRCEKEFRKFVDKQIDFTGKDIVQMMALEQKGSGFARLKLLDLGYRETVNLEHARIAGKFFAALDRLIEEGLIVNYSIRPERICVRFPHVLPAIKRHIGLVVNRQDYPAIKSSPRCIESSKLIKQPGTRSTIRVWIFTPPLAIEQQDWNLPAGRCL